MTKKRSQFERPESLSSRPCRYLEMNMKIEFAYREETKYGPQPRIVSFKTHTPVPADTNNTGFNSSLIRTCARHMHEPSTGSICLSNPITCMQNTWPPCQTKVQLSYGQVTRGIFPIINIEPVIYSLHSWTVNPTNDNHHQMCKSILLKDKSFFKH